MKVGTAALFSTIALATAQSASADSGSKRLEADLIGFNEPPSVSTPASGDFDARLDEDAQEITWRLRYGGFGVSFRTSMLRAASLPSVLGSASRLT